MPACDCCGRMMGHGQGHQHPTDDALVCDQCFIELRKAATPDQDGPSTQEPSSAKPPAPTKADLILKQPYRCDDPECEDCATPDKDGPTTQEPPTANRPEEDTR